MAINEIASTNSWRFKNGIERQTGCPSFREQSHIQGGELESLMDSEAHQVGVGGVFVRGFGRNDGAQIVGEETMRRAGIEAEQGTVSILLGGGVTGTEAHAHESEFDNGSGVKLGLLVQPCPHCNVIHMSGPAAGEQ